MIDLEPVWLRRPDEGDREWDTFRVYRDTHPRMRSVVDVATSTGVLLRDARTWCEAHHWADRAAAYDAYKAERDLAWLDDAPVQRVAHQRELVAGMWELAKCHLRDALRDAQAGTSKLRPNELIKLLEKVVVLDRMTHDEATEVVTVQTKYDLSKLSIEELENLRALQRKAT